MNTSTSMLADIKLTLEGYIGRKIHLKANSGRRKVVERTGILESTYPSIFVVKLDKDQNTIDRVSYSYADILTEAVELTVLENEISTPISYVKVAQ